MDVDRLVLVGKAGNLATEVRPVGIGVAVPGALEVVVRRQSQTDLVRADGISASLKNLKEESAAVLNGATILVCAGVDVVVEELLKKITVGA